LHAIVFGKRPLCIYTHGGLRLFSKIWCAPGLSWRGIRACQCAPSPSVLSKAPTAKPQQARTIAKVFATGHQEFMVSQEHLLKHLPALARFRD
jgi:hypothetical protein